MTTETRWYMRIASTLAVLGWIAVLLGYDMAAMVTFTLCLGVVGGTLIVMLLNLGGRQ